VVLVDGAFADATGWISVFKRLQADGYPVIAPAKPLRSLSSDSAYIASVLAQTPGPLVVVGHSYGGAVTTNAAAGKQERESHLGGGSRSRLSRDGDSAGIEEGWVA
jgi:pimeloyl-ACP methyl ester carboxylesterase